MGAADIEVGTAVETDIDVNRVMELIPHRYPFLMVDKIEEIELGANRRLSCRGYSGQGSGRQAGLFHDHRRCPFPQARGSW